MVLPRGCVALPLLDPIFLPDSTSDEPGSHGFVSFNMDVRPGLLVGESVPNEANIYFDFNEPVITDPCLLTVLLPESIDVTEQENVRVYPVPSRGLLNVQQDGTWTNALVTIIDARGSEVLVERISSELFQIDLRPLPSGLYVLRLQKNGTNWSQRVVRE